MCSIKVAASSFVSREHIEDANQGSRGPVLDKGSEFAWAGPTRPNFPNVKMMYGGRGDVSVVKALVTQG